MRFGSCGEGVVERVVEELLLRRACASVMSVSEPAMRVGVPAAVAHGQAAREHPDGSRRRLQRMPVLVLEVRLSPVR